MKTIRVFFNRKFSLFVLKFSVYLHRHALVMLKWFCLHIQDGHHGSHLENLQNTSPECCRIELTIDGRHWGVMEMRSAKMVPFRYGGHLERLETSSPKW